MTEVQARVYEHCVAKSQGNPLIRTMLSVGEIVESMGFEWPEDGNPDPMMAKSIEHQEPEPEGEWEEAPAEVVESDGDTIDEQGTPLQSLDLSPGVLKSLASAGLTSVEQVEEYQHLTTLPGIGKQKESDIREAISAFRGRVG